MNKIFKKELFKTTKEKLWEAITNPDKMKEWFLDANFRPEVGYQYTFTKEPHQVKGEVLEVIPFEKLVYTWVVKNTNEKTIVTWELSEVVGRIEVKLTHEGFDLYDNKSQKDMFDSSVRGWEMVFSELKKYLTI